MKKIIKFNDGEINVSFNKSVHVEVDVKHNKTLLEIPGIPADYQDSKKVQVTAPTLAHTNRFFIAADDHNRSTSNDLPRVIQFLRWYKELWVMIH